jgi:hypothetical protein
VITPQIRRSALGNFPLGTPFLIVAAESSGFAQIVAERGDPTVAWTPLTTEPPPSATPHVLLEGIDDLFDPVAYLRELRTAMPDARIFALISNAGHLTGLGAFFAGRPLAAGHPISHGEIGPLFADAGWNVLAIKPLPDDALPPADAAPVVVTVGGIGLQCFTADALERGRTAGFLVIADRA